MKSQLEPVGQQRLHHQLHLIITGVPSRLRGHVVPVGFDPGWTAGVLEWLDSICPFEQELQRGSARPEASPRKREPDHSGVFSRRLGSSRFARRDRCHFKRWTCCGLLGVAVSQQQNRNCCKSEASFHICDYKMPTAPRLSRSAKICQEPSSRRGGCPARP
jgi:hypothetical protein